MEKVKANHEFWFKLVPIHQGIVFTSSYLDSIIILSRIQLYTWCPLVLARYKYFLLGTTYNSISANLSRSKNYINYKSCAVVFDLFIALDLSHHWDLFYIYRIRKLYSASLILPYNYQPETLYETQFVMAQQNFNYQSIAVEIFVSIPLSV